MKDWHTWLIAGAVVFAVLVLIGIITTTLDAAQSVGEGRQEWEQINEDYDAYSRCVEGAVKASERFSARGEYDKALEALNRADEC